MTSGRRGGFTLVEVLVAIAITGLVLLAARSALQQVLDTGRLAERGIVQEDTRANRDRLLSTLLEGTRLTHDGSIAFEGSSTELSFISWCDNVRGWQAPCRVTVRLTAESPQQVVVTMGQRRVVTHREIGSGHIEYLIDAKRGGRWVRSWNSTATAPLAIRLLLDGDTILFRIGERG